ncbi:methyltransferase family protein [Enterobacter sp. BIGb0383]|uniref:class I SAM-dependent methyltransferase n=1 Tax=unclassified Enterobacter TaxID=2608935 RepID=UPI000F484474|nr:MULTISPECIES: class I SAM-dependent methyltransferase [unclassified Enterobacter]ROP62978.1 methyltransferase family protein [Enterobacter sp. BIGb0383]ROS13139.1 methyltransferase family protein [Enterobacter sp. BIGb0359]
MSEDEIMALLSRWDRQQEGYIEQREERFKVMFDVIESVLGGSFTAIDAACGPGSLSKRLLDRFPQAHVIAVDADVMLLELARVSLAHYGERAQVIEADLGLSSWSEKVLAAAQAANVDTPSVLLSTTALHWLMPGELAEFYGAAGDLLKPGGMVMNGDHMRFDSRLPTPRQVAKQVREKVEQETVALGEDDWASWWLKAEKIPRLKKLKVERDARYAARQPKRKNSGEDCPVDFHVASLRHAGFTEAGTIWQYFDNYIVFGRKPLSDE